jgi:hypothetical protein
LFPGITSSGFFAGRRPFLVIQLAPVVSVRPSTARNLFTFFAFNPSVK